MQRTMVMIGKRSYALAQGADLALLKAQMENALQEGGAFLELVVVGNHLVTVLITPGVLIAFEIAEVPDDDRDTGDIGAPYEALDLLDRGPFLDY